ncbi:replication initiator protein [Blackfly microvirus SF02]|uniref:Replication initiator protein n=1 Tax=Blackfly microvirus SF02 TaxID=2576452 RepID=A0A4V1F5H5_9VIRU|nr:replication initiator protein [Blackfly microvirus SF02]
MDTASRGGIFLPCFHPAKAQRDDKGGVRFVGQEAKLFSLRLACRQCIGCRLESSRQWAVRCMHEASLYDDNSFVTLTYDDVHCPPTLIYWHFQDFMKRLRKTRPDVRFYMAGEYGAKFGRPHFHALLFNCGFPDKYVIRQGDRPLYRSPALEKLWKVGFSSIGAVTFESAAYVARYCTAKITGDLAEAHYALPGKWTDRDTGEIFDARVPEFNHMSLRNAVGKDWLRLYWSDVREGRVVVNGKECNVPRYYARYFKNSSYGEALKLERRIDGYARRLDNTAGRLLVKEAIASSRFATLERSL